MKRNLISVIAAAGIIAASCNKPVEKAVTTTVTSDTTFNLVNRDSLPMQVTLYRQLNDLRSGTNPSISVLVPARNNYKIPFSRLDTSLSAQYYYELHTPDYRFSNWASYYDQFYPLFYQGHSFYLSNIAVTQASYYFMHGADASTTWKAVDKVDWNGSSVWSSLSDEQKYMVVTIKRDKTGTIQSKSGGVINTRTADDLRSGTSSSGPARLSVYISGSSTYELYSVTRYADINGFMPRNSRDTMMMSDGSYWVLARQ